MSPTIPTPDTTIREVLSGGGELGALVRSMDWSKTALGPAETWPQSLRTTVGTCLNSRFPIVMWWGPELVTIYNDGYRPMLGNKHPRSLGRGVREVWPEIWDIIGPMPNRVMTKGEATWSENQHLALERHGFAEECYFTFSYSPIRDESGGVGGVFCAVAETTSEVIDGRRLRALQDLSHRTAHAKTAEEACTLAAAVLHKASADLPFAALYLLESAGTRARLIATAGSGLPDTGHAAITELTEGGQKPWWLAAVAHNGQPKHLEEIDDSMLESTTAGGSAAARSAFIVPVGRPTDPHPAGVLVAGISAHLAFDDKYRAFLKLAAGEIATAILNAKSLQEAQERAEALAALDRAKTTFFSNVSHEFRTPLTLMIGPTEDALASEGRSLNGEDLETVYRNELRLLKLVNSLLDFSRIEAGRMHAAYEPADLSALTADLASAFRSMIERGGVRFEVDCPALPEPVYVDREMWEKIVLNLLSNAFKFTFDGVIRVRLRASEESAELEVIDTGVGIPAPELPRLFERFHRIEGVRSRTHEGSGIGLALIKSLVELHGGSIRVTSRAGEGTAFTVSVPFGTAHLPADRLGAERKLASTATTAESFVAEAARWLPDASPEPVRGSMVAPGAARVLVADDNADMRGYLARLLREHWIVEAVADGDEALAAIRERRPDLVLADVMMPNVDGLTLLRALRAEQKTSEIPVIVLSARAGEEARIEGIEAGADDYLVKPFSARELVARVSTQLALAQNASEREELLGRETEARREAELQKQHLTTLFTQAPMPIVILRGSEYVVEFANDQALQLWGRRRADVMDKPLFEALPEIRDQVFRELLDGVRRTGEPYVGKETPADLDLNGDGELQKRFLNFVYAPLRNVRGDVDGVLVIASDVTDEILARDRMSELRAQAEVANRAKDEFLAMLGHELRNPLAPILTALQLMRLRGGDVLAKERAVIERQADQLLRLIDDLLDVARITRGKIELKKQRVELSEIVARGIETTSPMLEQREHHLSVDVPHEGLAVDGDIGRLIQVVANLLTNAAKYTERGGSISIEGGRRADHVLLAVKDTGIGMLPALLSTVFDRFTQGGQPLDRAHGGIGLGLAVARSLVELHGGSIGATSEGERQRQHFHDTAPGGTSASGRSRRAAPHAAQGATGWANAPHPRG